MEGALRSAYSIMLDTLDLVSTEKVAQRDVVEGKFLILAAQWFYGSLKAPFLNGPSESWSSPPTPPTADSLVILTFSTGGFIRSHSTPTSLWLMIQKEINLKGHLVNIIRKHLPLPKILFCRLNHILPMWFMTCKVSSSTDTPLCSSNRY